MGKRSRKRGGSAGGPAGGGDGFTLPAGELTAPTTEYTDADGNVLELRGALTLKARQEYANVLHGGLNQDDAWQRAIELLFERLAVAWTINAVRTDRQKELLQRYRVASAEERRFVRDSLRAHAAEWFPDIEAPDMLDPDTFAAVICDWCLEVQPGQKVLISSSVLASEPAVALIAALAARGAWAALQLSPDGAGSAFYANAREELLDAINPFTLEATQTADALLSIRAPANTREMSGIDPALLARAQRASEPLFDIQMAKRWAVSIWPTSGLAQEAQMSLRDYTDFIEAALFLDQPDPIAAWQALHDRQQVLVDRLASAREVRIQSDRTDITLNVEGRTWINSDGKRNMPSGEVFTSPHETSANGQIRFDVPSNHGGTNVGGVAVTFVDGVITEAHADHGDERLQAELGTDAGARRLGEIGIGTNYGIGRATGSTLLDEKIGGSVHLALGRSYPECGGQNESAIHWDLICDLRPGGEITVDGEVISRDGVFV